MLLSHSHAVLGLQQQLHSMLHAIYQLLIMSCLDSVSSLFRGFGFGLQPIGMQNVLAYARSVLPGLLVCRQHQTVLGCCLLVLLLSHLAAVVRADTLLQTKLREKEIKEALKEKKQAEKDGKEEVSPASSTCSQRTSVGTLPEHAPLFGQHRCLYC